MDLVKAQAIELAGLEGLTDPGRVALAGVAMGKDFSLSDGERERGKKWGAGWTRCKFEKKLIPVAQDLAARVRAAKHRASQALRLGVRLGVRLGLGLGGPTIQELQSSTRERVDLASTSEALETGLKRQ